MLQKIAAPEFRQIDPAAVVFSKSTAQAERRKHFDKEQLKDLIASVTEKGIVQPIVVRAVGDLLEVVAGERRVLAAREAGLGQVPAMVHVLTDEQALDLQLIENLQREGLHPLVEAEGYEALKNSGHSIEQIAERVGKSASYVYKRLDLARCGKKARAAFYDGTLDASKALVISRLPESLQDKALKEIVALETSWNGPMSFRSFVDYMQREYMLRLDQAPFKTEDATLVVDAGPCGKCPKNTASQSELFGDVSNKAALCTDSACFNKKIAAAGALRVQAAKDAGRPILEGKDAKKAIDTYGGDYARPDRHVDGDQQYRTYQKLLGRDLGKVITVAVDPSNGQAVELVDKKAARQLIKDKGIKLSAPSPSPTRSKAEIEKEKAEKAKRDAAEKLDFAIAKAIHAKVPKPFTRDELLELAQLAFEHTYGDGDKLLEVLGSDTAYPQFEKLNEAGLLRAIRSCLIAGSIAEGDRKALLDHAKRHGVDIEKVKAELEPKDMAPPGERPPKKAKKKASKKK